MNEQLCWRLIDSAWAVFPPLDQTRKRAIALKNITALEQLSLMLDRLISVELQKQLKQLSKEELIGFIHFFEQQLAHLADQHLPAWSQYKKSDIHLATAFAIGMGQHYFQQVKRQPALLHVQLQAISFALLPYTTYEQEYGILPTNFQQSPPSLSKSAFNRSSRRP
ncbi:MAG: hypothetical protein AAFP19_01035 [Bacteroidota bacterium]